VRIPAKHLQALAAAQVPMALVLGVSVWMAWPLVRDPPLDHDHSVRLFQAWHFWSEMLGRGRLTGWSHFWAFGYPAGELNPFGSELWVALFRAATLGLASWAKTYGLALAGMLVFTSWAMFRFARRFLGGRAVAVVAALGWLLDPGAPFQGGWEWCVRWGVWPVTLGLSYALLGLETLDRVITERRNRDIAYAGIWLALSLITHQLSLVVYAVSVPALLLDHWLRPRGLVSGGLVRCLLACAFGGALAAFYLVPMLARTEETLALGALGAPLSQLAANLVDLRLFGNMWPPLLLLGLLGAFFGVRSRRPAGLFLAVSAGILVLFSSDLLVNVLHAERLVKSVLKFESGRMLLGAKLFWFPLAAQALVTLVRRPRYRPLAQPGLVRGRLGLLVGAALAVPLLWPACQRFYAQQVEKVYPAEQALNDWPELRALFEWSRELRQKSSEFYRIAYDFPTHEHLSSLAPMFDGTLYYKVGYTPAQQFRNFPMSREPELLEALSVKYLVSDRTPPLADFVGERQFGKLGVYRFLRYRSEPFTLSGSARVELLSFEPEYIHFRLSAVAPGSQLKVHVANYDRWQATLAGSEVVISPAPVYGQQDPILMELPITNGNLVLRYVRRAPDWIGLVLSLSAFPLFGLLAYADARRRTWPRLAVLGCKLRAWRRWPCRVGVATGAIAAAWAVWRFMHPSSLLAASSLFQSVKSGELSVAGQPCHSSGTLAWQCGPHAVSAGVVRGEGLGLLFCLSAPAVGELVLALETEPGRFLEGRYRPAPGSGRFRLFVGERLVGEADTHATTREDRDTEGILFDTRSMMGRGPLPIRLELSGAALHCFDARWVR
jgi:hypothetical protein